MTEWSPQAIPALCRPTHAAGRRPRRAGSRQSRQSRRNRQNGADGRGRGLRAGGNSTAVLRHTFPEARLLGVDLSPEMVERAARRYPEIAFRVGDAASLTGQYDLIFFQRLPAMGAAA